MREIDHLNLTVSDLEKTVKFYTETLGFTEQHRFSNGERTYVFVNNGTLLYEIGENKDLKNGELRHIAYVSTDIQSDYNFYKEKGLTTTTLNCVDFMFEKGMRYFFIAGPCGESIEFCQKVQ